jgi:hypothetical protein
MNGGDDDAQKIPVYLLAYVNKREALIDREGYPMIVVATICVYGMARHVWEIYAVIYEDITASK